MEKQLSTEMIEKIQNSNIQTDNDFLDLFDHENQNNDEIYFCNEIDFDKYELMNFSKIKILKDIFYLVNPINLIEDNIYSDYINNISKKQNIARKFMFDNKKYWKIISFSISKNFENKKLIPPYNYSIFEKIIYEQNTTDVQIINDKLFIYSSPIPNNIIGIQNNEYRDCYYVITIELIKNLSIDNLKSIKVIFFKSFNENCQEYKLNIFNENFNKLYLNMHKYCPNDIFEEFTYIYQIFNFNFKNNIWIYIDYSFFVVILYFKQLILNNISNLLFLNCIKSKNNAISFLTIDALRIIDDYFQKNE